MAQSTARATPEVDEARKTGRYARAFRCLVKKRQAIKNAAPFTAAIIAVAESWLYANGVLCHVQDRMLRVLDLHKSATEETVIDIRSLLDEAIVQSRGIRKYRFQLLHYSNGIVSCLYTRFRPDVESYLVVFDLHRRKILPISRSLESTNKIFVRNDDNYLYCGTHSEFGEDGFRRWVLIGYDIKAERWFDHKVHLLDMVGSDIGQSISFDIIDGYFYGLSNQTSFEIDEVDWTSYYHCFKFPVGQPEPEHIQRSTKDRMWRRQHAEGPIDDRWSFLRLLKNEQSGKLQILESRREWLDRKSSAQRTYYTTELHFPSKSDGDINEETGGQIGNTTIHGGDQLNATTLNPNAGDTIPPRRFHTNWALPLSPEPARVRDPYNTHVGDDASTALLFTLSKCFIRSYYASSQTFIDLVDNPQSCDPESPRLQLRAGSRELRPFTEVHQLSPAYNRHLPHVERIEHLYKENGANKIVFWPPASQEASEVCADADALDQLSKVLNPPSHVGSVKGTWDDRSFVYSTGNNPDGVQALVFLSFDSAIRLQALKIWGQEQQQEEYVSQEEPSTNTSAPEESITVEGGNISAKGLGEDESGKRNAEKSTHEPIHSPSTSTALSEEDSQQTLVDSMYGEDCVSSTSEKRYPEPHDGSVEVQTIGLECNWAWREPAMYRQIAFGFSDLPDFTSRRQNVASRLQ